MTRRPPHGPGADVSGRNDTTLERRRGGGSRGSGRHRPADSITRGPPSGRPAGRPGILHLMLDHRVGPARIMAGRDRRRRRRRASVATRGVSLRAWFGVPLTGTAQVIAGCTVAARGQGSGVVHGMRVPPPSVTSMTGPQTPVVTVILSAVACACRTVLLTASRTTARVCPANPRAAGRSARTSRCRSAGRCRRSGRR